MSIRSKLIISMLKNRHLFKGKLKREVVDSDFDIDGFRDEVDRATANLKVKGTEVEAVDCNGIYGEWITPANPVNGKVLLYIHGGGFISGSCNTHRLHVSKFAIESGLKSLVFNYSLAPEVPFPGALDDCFKVYCYLLESGYSERDIIIGGESAGGTLTLSLLLKIKEMGMEQPCGAFSISPITDLSCRAKSFSYNYEKDIAPLNSWIEWTRLYIGNTDFKNPLLSPQFGDFKGICPIYICVGDYEIHYDDCREMYKKLTEDGVDARLKVWPEMVHAFPILSPLFPEAKRALKEICCYSRELLSVITDI